MTTMTVTIPRETFVRDAAKHASSARLLLASAHGYAAEAHRRAAAAPSDWTSPGGASAAEILAMIETDVAEVRKDAIDAARYANDTEAATDVPAAAHAEELARVYASSAKFTADTIARFTRYLPLPA